MRVRTFPPALPGLRPAAMRGTAIDEVRRFHMRAVRWLLPWHIAAKKRFLAGLVWPFIAFWKAAFIYTPRCGAWVAREFGIPRWRQILDQVKIAITAQMLPQHYYLFELYRPEMRRRYHEYLVRNETKAGVFSILKIGGKRDYIFRDKVIFAEECAKAGIRHAPILARFSEGGVAGLVAGGLPPADLFAKLFNGKGGKGAERWAWDGACYRAGDGRALTAEALLRHYCERSAAGKGDMILQPLLVNHPAYAGLSNGVLSTIRIMTCLNERMEGEVITAAMRLAVEPGKVVDNFHAGGIGANVDIATGILGPASNMGLKGSSIWHDVHPVTGARIAGFEVPFWEDAKALARTAHEKIGDRVVIGWDIAILPDGPCLVEGNGRTSVDLVQRARRAPLGETRLPELMAFHLRRMYPIWQEKRRRAKTKRS